MNILTILLPFQNCPLWEKGVDNNDKDLNITDVWMHKRNTARAYLAGVLASNQAQSAARSAAAQRSPSTVAKKIIIVWESSPRATNYRNAGRFFIMH